VARKNVIQFSVEVVDKFSTKLGTMSQKFGAFAKKLSLAAAGIGAALLVATKRAIGMADQLGKTAKVIGVSAETLQEFRFAAAQSGVEARGLDDSLRRMQRRMGEFINSGAGPAQKAIESLGIEITDASGKFIGTERAFFRVVDAMQSMETVAERSAVAAQLFGDDFGPKLVTLTDQGVDGIKALTDEARRLGLVIDNESIAKAEKAQDAFNRLETAIRTKFIQAFADNAEAIELMATAFLNVVIESAKAFTEFGKWMGLIDKTVADLQGELAGLLAEQIEFVNKVGETVAAQSPYFERLEGKIADVIAQITKLNNLRDDAPDGEGGGSGAGGGGTKRPTTLSPLEKPGTLVGTFDGFAEWLQQNEMSMIPERLLEGLGEVSEKTKEISETAQDLGLQFVSAFEDAIVEGKKFREVMQGLLKDMLRLVTRKLLTEPFTAFFSEMLEGRAGGGPVSKGTPYIVGERGPEMFIPNASGSIASNSALMSGAGGMQFVTKIDARGADPGLIARLPQYMEQRDRRLMMKVKEYVETGSVRL